MSQALPTPHCTLRRRRVLAGAPRLAAAPPLLVTLIVLTALTGGCAPPETDETPDLVTAEEAARAAEASDAAAEATPPRPDGSKATCRRWLPVETDSTASLRGLSAVSTDEVWVSGTAGTFGRSLDGGRTFTFGTVTGAEELDFRDIDAFEGGVAYAMAAGPGALSQIYKTDDGGVTWTRRYLMESQDGFFDGLAFWNAERGLAYGDPVDGAFFLLRTDDGGDTWSRVDPASLPAAAPAEAGFAASGSGLAVGPGGLALFGSGGGGARVFRSTDYGRTWTAHDTPIASGEPSQGIFSIAILDRRRAVAVGGDYKAPEQGGSNAAWSSDGGRTWTAAEAPPIGYRSAVVAAEAGVVTAGLSGADLSFDGGETWRAISANPPAAIHALAAADGPCAVWAAGPEGVILRWAEAVVTPPPAGDDG